MGAVLDPDAATSEVQSIEPLVDERLTRRKPKRLLYDKAADADWLRESLAIRGIVWICPHRENRTLPPANDGRVLRRYKRRYRVERSISWLYNFRRLITQYTVDPRTSRSGGRPNRVRISDGRCTDSQDHQSGTRYSRMRCFAPVSADSTSYVSEGVAPGISK